MKKNIGSLDKIIRIIIGIALISLVFIGPKTYWGLVGLIPLVTALIGFCPLYPIIGLSTCKTEAPEETPSE